MESHEQSPGALIGDQEQPGDCPWLASRPRYWIIRHTSPVPIVPGIAYLATNRFCDSADETLITMREGEPDVLAFLAQSPNVISVVPASFRYFVEHLDDEVIAVLNPSEAAWFASLDEALQWDPFEDAACGTPVA